MNRYNQQNNYVAGATGGEDRQLPALAGADALMGNEGVIHVGQPLASHHGAHEQTSGMDRSLALLVKSAPFTVVWLLLTVGIVWVSPMGAGWGFVVFSGLTAFTYGRMMKTDHEFSRNGVERFKVETLGELKSEEMQLDHERKMYVIESQIRMWEAQGYGGGRQITVEGRAVGGRVTPAAAGHLEARRYEEAGED